MWIQIQEYVIFFIKLFTVFWFFSLVVSYISQQIFLSKITKDTKEVQIEYDDYYSVYTADEEEDVFNGEEE
jgi:hypothetical protein